MALRILPLTSSDKEQVYEFAIKWFFPFEPISASWVTIPKITELPFIRAIDQGLSLKAVDDSGNIAAVCINADLNNLNVFNMDLPSNLVELHKFIKLVESECEEIDNSVSVLVVAVADTHRQQGVCTKLLNSSVKVASDQGFRNIKIFCTSKHSASAAHSVGWKCMLRKPYVHYKDPVSGDQLYSPCLPHTHVSVYMTSVCP